MWEIASRCALAVTAGLRGFSVAASCGSLDHDGFAGIDHGSVAGFEGFDAAILAPHRILADLTGFTAGKAEWPHPAVARQDRAVHLFKKADGAENAVTCVPFAA